MPFLSHPALTCPLDGLPLHREDRSLSCSNRHSFDLAKQGYVNLLSSQDKRSKDPGDSSAMVAARHQFLEAGHYRPIAGKLGELLIPYVSAHSLIVDAGCGDAYYLSQLREQILAGGLPEPRMLGFDISKPAMQVAARRFSATWLVASNRSIPLADASADIVIDMFGFPQFASFARILKHGGVLLRVLAGPKHLLELRELIYPELKERERSRREPEGFSLKEKLDIEFEISELDRNSIADLLLMTPHLFRASRLGKERVAALESLSLTVDVSLELFKRDDVISPGAL